MVEGAEKYIGKTMDWNEIVSLFPDCFVALDDYKSTKAKTTAKLVFVCKKEDDMIDILEKYAENGNKLHTSYTTESEEWNGLCQL